MVDGVLMGPERRRRWNEGQKMELLAEAFGPGGNVTETARRADIHTSLLYRWRRESRAMLAGPVFAPAVLVDAADQPERTERPAIVVVLAGDVQVQVMPGAPAALVATTLRALR